MSQFHSLQIKALQQRATRAESRVDALETTISELRGQLDTLRRETVGYRWAHSPIDPVHAEAAELFKEIVKKCQAV